MSRLLFAQGGDCFFCKLPLPKADASVEHLVALANGGPDNDTNCVVCCQALNSLLGSMSLKEKIQVMLNQKANFLCPNGNRPGEPTKAHVEDGAKIDAVIANLNQRGNAKPKTRIKLAGTITALFPSGIAEAEVQAIINNLQSQKIISFEGDKVSYGIN